ncbi:UMTA methyltransferase [Zalerion maritima]|uniref:UMTA methyltransferase n=1 Tax=Zalerion maritima TaxID=339359 RepID=A0AAD5RMJ8_9PEZI|nr:UMTA methyltransferase [Zalerion maritima]
MATDPTLTELDNDHLETVVYHNREYQLYALVNNIYFEPVDEDEVWRLQMLDRVFNLVFDNRLIFPPIHRLRRILECGYGAGGWAIATAQAHPTCEVSNLSRFRWCTVLPLPRMGESSWGMNNVNKAPKVELFAFSSNYFDLVHSQMVAGGVNSGRWSEYLRDIYRVIRPGGWCQMVELYHNAQSDNGTLTPQHALSRWSHLYLEAAALYKDPRAANHMGRRMRQAGFQDIEITTITLPMCAWPTVVDPSQHNIGLANTENIGPMLSSLATYPFTELLGMSITDVQLLVAQAKAEAANPGLKPYFPL